MYVNSSLLIYFVFLQKGGRGGGWERVSTLNYSVFYGDTVVQFHQNMIER